jgi:protein TonB
VSLNIAVNHSNNSQFGAINANSNTLMWAVICSILLHILLAFVIPNLKFDANKKPELLVVELSKKSEPPPVVISEPVKAEPEPIKPKIEPKPKLKPINKPLPTPTVVKNEPAPYLSSPAVVTHQTEVIAVAPKADATPSPAPPAPIVAPEPPKPAAVSQEDIDDARGKYGNTLWGAIGKYKQYPRIAQMRGWQGEAIVELLLDGNGKLKSKKIIQSSGFESLDKQALEMVEKAAPFPAPPEALRGSNFSIKVPIPFKLEEQQ